MERGNRPVAGDPFGYGSAWNSDTEFCADPSRGLLLRMPKVVNAEGSRDDPGRILDPFQPGQERKVPGAILTPVDLNLAIPLPA